MRCRSSTSCAAGGQQAEGDGPGKHGVFEDGLPEPDAVRSAWAEAVGDEYSCVEVAARLASPSEGGARP